MAYLPLESARGTGASPIPGYDPFSALLHTVMATELRDIRERLEALAEVLVGDAYFVDSYVEELQAFDYLIQHADECSNLLQRIAAGENSLEAINHVRLGAVQERLRAALDGA